MQGVNTLLLSLYPIGLLCPLSNSQPRPTPASLLFEFLTRFHPDFVRSGPRFDSIREHDKGLRLQGVRGIGDGVVESTLNIAQEVFDSKPVGPARIGVESGQYSNSICDMWMSSGSKVHQSTNSREIRSLMMVSAS